MESPPQNSLNFHPTPGIMKQLESIGRVGMDEQRGAAGACQIIAQRVQEQLGFPRLSLYIRIAPHEYWAHEVNIPPGRSFVLGKTPIIDAGSLQQINSLLDHFQQRDQYGITLQIPEGPLIIYPEDPLYGRFTLSRR